MYKTSEEIRIKSKAWKDANREHVIQQAREYNARTAEERTKKRAQPGYKARQKRWTLQNIKSVIAYQEDYQNSHKDKWAGYQQGFRLLVIEYYSHGTMVCEDCGSGDIRALVVHHNNGGGNDHRKAVKSNNIYRWLVKNNFPEGYSILCGNCNMERDYTDGRRGIGGRGFKWRQKVKADVLNHYSGGKMHCNGKECEKKNIHILTMDHVDGDGHEHRKEVKGDIYLWLRNHNYPTPERFQVLCINCQMIKRIENKEHGRRAQ